MGNNLNRYLWLIDTLRRYGRLTLQELNDRWALSPFADGASRLPRRTFYAYRDAILQMFGINICCDKSTYEYYIADDDDDDDRAHITAWLLDSAATTGMLSQSRDLANRILLEEVPSARQHLAPITDALRGSHPILFDYHPYTRVKPSRGVRLEPYFLRIFRQLWYVTGRNMADGKVKTYALDRISNLQILTDTFSLPPDADPHLYFRDSFGIIVNDAPVHSVRLRVDPRQAKYFRALPLHPSQKEEVADDASYFSYRMRLTPDLVQELLSHGPRITVISPPELRAMVASELAAALAPYQNPQALKC